METKLSQTGIQVRSDFQAIIGDAQKKISHPDVKNETLVVEIEVTIAKLIALRNTSSAFYQALLTKS